jgi:hypothetical protein
LRSVHTWNLPISERLRSDTPAPDPPPAAVAAVAGCGTRTGASLGQSREGGDKHGSFDPKNGVLKSRGWTVRVSKKKIKNQKLREKA